MKPRPLLPCHPIFIAACGVACLTQAASLELRVHDGDGAHPMPCRVHLTDAAGKPVQPPGFPRWYDQLLMSAANLIAALTNEPPRAAVLEPVRAAERFGEEKLAQAIRGTPVTGRVLDEATGEPIPCRLYVSDAQGRWFFPESAAAGGSAVRYERQNWANRNAVENHTTLSAHPFRLDLEPGRYTLTVERGKEYRPLIREVEIGAAPVELRLPLRRWVNLAARGWYSGDTHVHRTLAELPNVMLAEDLNVAFPLTYWVTKGFAPPTLGDKNTDAGGGDTLIPVDATHVIWPRNTEWEIFTLGERRHTLGAVFALGHRAPLEVGAPPVGPVAEAAHRDGALLDLDKHDWPWAMALVPVMGVDLFELANNHLWRTEFGFTNWTTPAPAWMGLPHAGRRGSERDWALYGFQNYYVLLNCGFRLRPTAGTASGVHPVPLGFGRVYVRLPAGFSYDAWFQGLDAGRSFVTTGPMLLATVDGQDPGHRFAFGPGTQPVVRLAGEVLSETPVEVVEIVVNGTVVKQLRPAATTNADGASVIRFEEAVEIEGSAWLAVRCWESRPAGRMRFAHTAPWFVEVEGAPLRPKRREVEFLAQRVQDELDRSHDLLPPSARDEYRRALAAYQRLLEHAVP